LGFPKNYLFPGASAGPELASDGAAVFAFAAGADVFALAAGAAAFALASAEAAVLAFASPVFEFVSVEAGASTGASGLLLSTETLPVKAGIASKSADSINTDAAPMVIFDNTVAVPLGASAELETLLVNRAPASVLPGCSRTEDTRTKHERKNIP